MTPTSSSPFPPTLPAFLPTIVHSVYSPTTLQAFQISHELRFLISLSRCIFSVVAWLPPQVIGAVVRKHPVSTLGAPLLVLAILVALGVYGVLAGAASVADNNRNSATTVATDTSQTFALYVEKVRGWRREVIACQLFVHRHCSRHARGTGGGIVCRVPQRSSVQHE